MGREKQISGFWVDEIKVKKGDCLWKIVKASGYSPTNWRKFYDAPYNKTFKKTHPDPDLIYESDVFHIPCGEHVVRKKELIKKIKQNISELGKAKTEGRKRLNKANEEVRRAFKTAKRHRDVGDFAQLVIALATGGASAASRGMRAVIEAIPEFASEFIKIAQSKFISKHAHKDYVLRALDIYMKANDPNQVAHAIGTMIKNRKVSLDAIEFDIDKECDKLVTRQIVEFHKVEQAIDSTIAEQRKLLKQMSR